jgi:hypothetical protein
MNVEKLNPQPDEPQPPSNAAGKTAYSTFPLVTTHGPRDARSYHGKPEDWKRAAPKRTFGGKVV